MRKQGFTLLEVMVIVIIIGVLATLGVSHYLTAVERSRGMEAKAVFAELNKRCYDLWKEKGTNVDWACMSGTGRTDLGLGTAADSIPTACRPSHYFKYDINTAGMDWIQFWAVRCTAGGKTPDRAAGGTITYFVNYTAGTDTYTMNGPW